MFNLQDVTFNVVLHLPQLDALTQALIVLKEELVATVQELQHAVTDLGTALTAQGQAITEEIAQLAARDDFIDPAELQPILTHMQTFTATIDQQTEQIKGMVPEMPPPPPPPAP